VQVFCKIYFYPELLAFQVYPCIFVTMKEVITITEYAKREGIKRDTVYKRIYNNRLPKGFKVIKVAGRNFIQVTE